MELVGARDVGGLCSMGLKCEGGRWGAMPGCMGECTGGGRRGWGRPPPLAMKLSACKAS